METLKGDPPALVALCPPCTNEGGWFHLNRSKGDRLEYLQKAAQSRSYIRFCAKLFRLQVELGGRAMSDHPLGAQTWRYPEIQTLMRRYHTVRCHMCQYGLKVPGSERFIRKATRLLCSHANMLVLEKGCPGPKRPKHARHDHVAGSHVSVGALYKWLRRQVPREVCESCLGHRS